MGESNRDADTFYIINIVHYSSYFELIIYIYIKVHYSSWFHSKHLNNFGSPSKVRAKQNMKQQKSRGLGSRTEVSWPHRPYLCDCGVGFRNMEDSAESHACYYSCFIMVPRNVNTYCRKQCYQYLSTYLTLLYANIMLLCHYYTITIT
jgi:hypothetical protein